MEKFAKSEEIIKLLNTYLSFHYYRSSGKGLLEMAEELTADSPIEDLRRYYILNLLVLMECRNAKDLRVWIAIGCQNKNLAIEQAIGNYLWREKGFDDFFSEKEQLVLIEWIESRLLEIEYWDENQMGDFMKNYADMLSLERCALLRRFWTYSPEQLAALDSTNKFFVGAGRLLHHKAKSCENLQKTLWPTDIYTDIAGHFEASFVRHEGRPIDRWLAKQHSDDNGIGMFWPWANWNGYEDEDKYIYLRWTHELEDFEENPDYFEENPDYWRHWDEGFDRDKVKDIELSHIYHDIWDHMPIKYNVLDIIRIEEIQLNIDIEIEEKEEANVW